MHSIQIQMAMLINRKRGTLRRFEIQPKSQSSECFYIVAEECQLSKDEQAFIFTVDSGINVVAYVVRENVLWVVDPSDTQILDSTYAESTRGTVPEGQ